jgi:hypothetical protein
MPYTCQGPVSNGRFSILFEYPLTVDVFGGCYTGYVVINNDEPSESYEITSYDNPNISYILPPSTDTIYSLSNGDYLVTLNDSIIEEAQFSVANTILNDELVIPYILLTIQDSYIAPYLIIESSYDEISWDFGDGTTSTLANPTHNFLSSTPRTVTLDIFYQCRTLTLSSVVNPLGGNFGGLIFMN